ncbi:hypothetical protein DPMN_188883 [Dreissena polymorpha]|uniref:ATP-dependent DNA helicase n=1 Tax=Dreissena polymorpha TaxID=45954 RepID=A0A9D4DUK5_DREPO|nr:hypothetical protein DPMN_188883 [Dreissena polymorpha]
MSLNTGRKKALKIVLDGHNLVLLGAAGTGKSHLVRVIKEHCEKKHKRCAITATTGIACSVYPPDFCAMTIHRWSGIGDGRYSPKEISNIIHNNVKYVEVLDRIKNTDVLVVEECSLTSLRLMECLHEVCCLKDPSLYFGVI